MIRPRRGEWHSPESLLPLNRRWVWDAKDPEGKRSFAPTGDSMAYPYGEDAHGLAGGGVELGFAPGTRLSKADAVEMGDD